VLRRPGPRSSPGADARGALHGAPAGLRGPEDAAVGHRAQAADRGRARGARADPDDRDRRLTAARATRGAAVGWGSWLRKGLCDSAD